MATLATHNKQGAAPNCGDHLQMATLARTVPESSRPRNFTLEKLIGALSGEYWAVAKKAEYSGNNTNHEAKRWLTA